MSIILRLIPAAIIVAFVLLITPPALASTDASGSRLTQAIEDEIMWLSANVADTNETIRIKIFTPAREDGRRTLWQVCKFGSTGQGEYRCGIDVAPGSLAEKRQGAWIAKLFIGSELVARTKFFL